MTLDTPQILILVIVGILVIDAVKDIVRDLRMWRLMELLAGGQRAQTFPPVAPPVTPPTPPVGPGPVPPVKPPVVPDKPPVTPPVTPPVPPVSPIPLGHFKVLRGPCSYFGGPNDKGVKDDEGLALVERSDFGHGTWGGIFLPTQPPGTTGLARALNPDAHYIACRWDYTETSKKYLQGITVTVKNPANGKTATDVRPVDWGPGIKSRVADLSPGLMAFLGLNTDDIVEVSIPLPAGGPAQPAQPTTPSVGLQHNSWPTQAEVWAGFYDPVKLVHVQCPWVFTVEGTHSQTITIHEKCAASLTRVLNFIWENVGKSQDKIHEFGYDVYDGSYVVRPMRGGSHPSMHSYGVAMDWNAAENPQYAPLSKTKFKPNSLIVKAFKDEGWEWGGDWSPGSIDAMHFQAARVH
jgi:hypothetical protein